MLGWLVRSVCQIVNFLLGDAGSKVSAAEELELSLARSRDPYFHAFKARCMQWVYGDDPRRSLEDERVSG